MSTVVQSLRASEWERLFDPPGQRFELVNGNVVVNPAPRPIHQGIARRLANAFDRWCPAGEQAECDIEWRVPAGPGAITQALRPDVVVTRTEELRGVSAISAAPTLAVEVLSPSNLRADFYDKLAAYLANGLTCLVTVEVDDTESTVTIGWHEVLEGPLVGERAIERWPGAGS